MSVVEAKAAEGTTSACAENTVTIPATLEDMRNYLRVRGEYRFSWATNTIGTELPPRARRIRELRKSELSKLGTTSACAENTKPTYQG